MKVQVSSTIDKEDYDNWKKSGMKLGHVIRLGLMSANQTPGYLGRIKELEQGNEKLQRRITAVLQRLDIYERKNHG